MSTAWRGRWGCDLAESLGSARAQPPISCGFSKENQVKTSFFLSFFKEW